MLSLRHLPSESPALLEMLMATRSGQYFQGEHRFRRTAPGSRGAEISRMHHLREAHARSMTDEESKTELSPLM